MSQALAVAWYRFRATLGRRLSGYLSVVVLLALLGGLSMGALAAARRTQSSFSTYLASTNPSQLRLGTAVYQSGGAFATGYNPAIVKKIAHLPDVRSVESAALLNAVPYVRANGASSPDSGPAAGYPTGLNTIGSINGLYFDQDRVTITKGRMANPNNPDEIVVQSSQGNGVHLGERIAFGLYTNAQMARPGFTTASAPFRRVVVTVVGYATSNDSVVTDAVDAGGTFLVLFTPAFTKAFLNCCAKATPDTGVQVDGGGRDITKVENEIEGVFPKGFGAPNFYVTSVTEAKADRAIKPASIALGLFGLIAALAALLIVGQTICRQLRRGAIDQPVLRALGTSTLTSTCEGLVGIGMSILVGALLGVGIAIALSPIAPIGVVRSVYPDRGIAFDWTVLAFGFAVFLLMLIAVAIVASYRQTPQHGAKRIPSVHSVGAVFARKAAASGLPVPAVVGIGFATNSRAGRNTVPVRSAILGVALALMVTSMTLIFGASLHTLVSRPALYGWNWNFELLAGGGSSDIPQQQVNTLLRQDHNVAAWSGVYFSTLYLDGQLVPVLGARPGASVSPPLLSGHSLDSSDEVVLGAQTLADLHKHVGEQVAVRNGNSSSRDLRIVGTAVMPAIGSNFSQHLEMGVGALLSNSLIPAFDRNLFGALLTGPNAILVRLKPGSSQRSLDRIANEVSTTANDGVNVQSVQRPAEILNYRSLGTAPAELAIALAIGSAFAFGLTLVSSVQRRRRELALLKTLGFTRRQLAAVIAWQASIDVAVGTVVGVVAGVVTGRWLWNIFARNIGVVPQPTVPVLLIVLSIVGAFVLANVVAAVPGIVASRTKPASLFRTD